MITKGGCEGQDKLWCARLDETALRDELDNSMKGGSAARFPLQTHCPPFPSSSTRCINMTYLTGGVCVYDVYITGTLRFITGAALHLRKIDVYLLHRDDTSKPIHGKPPSPSPVMYTRPSCEIHTVYLWRI